MTLSLNCKEALDEISRLLSHPKVNELSKNPKRETNTGKGGPDIFEI
jgi:hypothetical protein